MVLLQLGQEKGSSSGQHVVRYQYYVDREGKGDNKVIRDKGNITNCEKLGQGKTKFCRSS